MSNKMKARANQCTLENIQMFFEKTEQKRKRTGYKKFE